jgi:prepilin-type N-terminal cleavage/methylation domain-containing protein
MHEREKKSSSMRNRAFTLVELLVVVAIIGLLGSIVISAVNVARTKAAYAAAKQLDANFYHNLGDSMVAQYLFEGDLKDSSGLGYDANIAGGTPGYSSSTPFGVGSSLSLNGSADFLHTPDTVLPSQGVCNFAVSAWSYDTGMPTNAGSVVGTSGTVTNTNLNVEYTDLQLRFRVANGALSDAQWVNGNYKGKWLFTILTLNNGISRGYINGSLVWTSTVNVGCVGSQWGWQIGKWGYPFAGYIDNVRIYDRALDTSEIQKLYAMDAARHGVAFVGPAPWSLDGMENANLLR